MKMFLRSKPTHTAHTHMMFGFKALVLDAVHNTAQLSLECKIWKGVKEKSCSSVTAQCLPNVMLVSSQG